MRCAKTFLQFYTLARDVHYEYVCLGLMLAKKRSGFAPT